MSRASWALVGVALVCVSLWAVSNSLPRDVWLTALGVVLGAMISVVFSWYYARKASEELRQRAEELGGLTIKLFQILDGANVIEVKDWDQETGEPSRWRVVKTIELLWNVEPPTRRKEQLKKRMRRERPR